MATQAVFHNGKVATNGKNYFAQAFAVDEGKISAVGTNDEIMRLRESSTQVTDLGGRTVIPGLNDSHLHIIRGGLNYNLELRWDGVPSLADAMRMLKEQAARTPAPQWVRVVGGWTEFQFAERRMPTLQEINEVAPDTPVFVLHLYDRAMLNAAAMRVVGYTKDSPNPPGGEIQKDKNGNLTGLLIATPNAALLYAALGKGPKLSYEDELISTRHFMRELNRLGVTSCIDAGGGSQNYPDDYTAVAELHKKNQMTVRVAYNLFTQRPKHELEDFQKWTASAKLYDGDQNYRLNGAGEMLTYSTADFEDFLQPRPELEGVMESELEAVIRLLAEKKWPFRIHATYDEDITRFMNVFEKVNRDVPFNGFHWFLDHCETIGDKNLERVAALYGGVAVQHRMAYQGEYFVKRYGAEAAKRTPPIRKMLEMGLPVGAGTDATRVASYNPFVALYWLTSGRTVGGLELYPEKNRMSREEALRLYTQGGCWFSTEDGLKGGLFAGQLADFAVLTRDYFSIPEEEIKDLQSALTVLGGQVVYANKDFDDLAPAALPVASDWAPTTHYGGYYNPMKPMAAFAGTACQSHIHVQRPATGRKLGESLWGLGCDCFAF